MYKVMKDRSRKKDLSDLVPVFNGCCESSPFSPDLFHSVNMMWADKGDEQAALHMDIGSLTVVDRMTGFGWRDIETGFCAPDGRFWLASGGFDVRDSGAATIGEAIEWVKRNANTCIPEPNKQPTDKE